MTKEEAIKDYIAYLISWLNGHCDLELDSQTEFEVIRVIFDSFETYRREQGKIVDNEEHGINIKDLDIKDITLLSIEEAENIPQENRKFYNCWWLRSNGFRSNFATFVYSSGSVDITGGNVDDGECCVRPVLIANNLESFNLPIYSKLVINNIEWIKISDNMLLCDDNSFGSHMFNEKGNDYETSEIKKYIHEKAKELGVLK